MNELKELYDHELKILPEYFKTVLDGSKTFEIRKNDRSFRVGDIITLREFDKNGYYTGNAISKVITYITDYEQKDNYIVMAIE